MITIMIAIGEIVWLLCVDANLHENRRESTTGLLWSGMTIVIAADDREKTERGK